MEKNQYDLVVKILSRLNVSGALDSVILVGSWCVPFYREYFGDVSLRLSIKTRDIDFLIPAPFKISAKIDIPALLKDLGFIVRFKGSSGYIKLEHPDLLIEFLVPEIGKGIEGPYRLPEFGINATALRFLNFLSADTIKVKVEDFSLTLPHPANFALHKLIIFQRRINKEKALKDRNTAVAVLKALVAKGEILKIKQVFNSIPKKWQEKIIKGLKIADEKGILTVLTAG